MVLAKHGVDGLCKLSTIRFVDIVYIYPEVFYAVLYRLYSAESDLVIARLTLASTIYQVSECHSSVSAPHVCESIAYRGVLSPKFLRLNLPLLLYMRRRIFRPNSTSLKVMGSGRVFVGCTCKVVC
jgi:hypothetical protein